MEKDLRHHVEIDKLTRAFLALTPHSPHSLSPQPPLMKEPSRPRGRPRKKRRGGHKRPAEPSPNPSPELSCDQPQDDADTDDDTGAPEEWDPHAGLKPSPFDNCGSDADIEFEDVLPYGAEQKISSIMVDMMVDLDDCDARDLEWLPPAEQRKLALRKTGMVNSASKLKPEDLLVFREKKVPLSWARCHCKVGTNTKTPQAR
jgi:hypothetical protein